MRQERLNNLFKVTPLWKWWSQIQTQTIWLQDSAPNHNTLLPSLYLYWKVKTFLYLGESLNPYKTALAQKGTSVLWVSVIEN